MHDEDASRHRRGAVQHRVEAVVERVGRHRGAVRHGGADAPERVGERRDDASAEARVLVQQDRRAPVEVLQDARDAVAMEKRAVRVVGTAEKDTTGTWAQSPMRATNSPSVAVRDPSIMACALAFLIRSTAALQATGQAWSSQTYRVSGSRHRKNAVTASSPAEAAATASPDESRKCSTTLVVELACAA